MSVTWGFKNYTRSYFVTVTQSHISRDLTPHTLMEEQIERDENACA
jgi:hypothetical protein